MRKPLASGLDHIPRNLHSDFFLPCFLVHSTILGGRGEIQQHWPRNAICSQSLSLPVFMLLIRFVYWLIRRREGIGLGDAKLMAYWPHGWPSTSSALVWYWDRAGSLSCNCSADCPVARRGSESWALSKLHWDVPLHCGIVSSLWVYASSMRISSGRVFESLFVQMQNAQLPSSLRQQISSTTKERTAGAESSGLSALPVGTGIAGSMEA